MTDETGDISLKDTNLITSSNRQAGFVPLNSALIRSGVGLAIASGIGYLGWRKGALTHSGAFGALVSGTVTAGRGGYGRAALLVGFFVASSLLSRLPERQELSFSSFTAKGGRRDAWQVAANGGASTLVACFGEGQRYRLSYLGALAAATGDTWATEIGRRWGGTPRHIFTLQPVDPGVSGGITLTGTLATVAGGGFIGLLGIVSGLIDPAFRARKRELLLTGAISGVFGSLVDSLVGATIQEKRWCDDCQKRTERPIHTCGSDTSVVGGIRGVDNDVVNLICTISGSATGWAIERRSNRQD